MGSLAFDAVAEDPIFFPDFRRQKPQALCNLPVSAVNTLQPVKPHSTYSRFSTPAPRKTMLVVQAATTGGRTPPYPSDRQKL